MRIGIITDAIDDAALDPVARAGIYRYTKELVTTLLEIDRNNEYVLIHHRASGNPFYEASRELLVPLYNVPLHHEARKALAIPLAVRKERLDVIHEPRGFIPHLFPRGVRKILTVHDLSTIFFPAMHTRLNALRIRLSLCLSMGKVDRIIAVSNFTKKELMNAFHIPDHLVHVVYEGVDENFKPIENCDVVLRKYGIERGFILFVGTLEPRKNLETALKAFYKLKKMNIARRFVIVGVPGWKSGKLDRIIDDLHLSKDITTIGYVPDGDLPALYSSSDLFVYPSVYEGFGLPLLEAMACGTPVLTTKSSSLPEVVGDAAITVDPYDVEGLAAAMHQTLTNDGLAESMAKKGIERARLFSWKETARRTLRVYEEATYSQ